MFVVLSVFVQTVVAVEQIQVQYTKLKVLIKSNTDRTVSQGCPLTDGNEHHILCDYVGKSISANRKRLRDIFGFCVVVQWYIWIIWDGHGWAVGLFNLTWYFTCKHGTAALLRARFRRVTSTTPGNPRETGDDLETVRTSQVFIRFLQPQQQGACYSPGLVKDFGRHVWEREKIGKGGLTIHRVSLNQMMCIIYRVILVCFEIGMG